MELIGEDEKIQALFLELRLADEHAMPRFAPVWNRAQLKVQPRRAFNVSFAAVTLVLLCALVSLAWWSRQWQRSQSTDRAVATTAPIKNVVTPPTEAVTTPSAITPRRQFSSKSPAKKFVARRQTEALVAKQTEIGNVTAISSWQSPTSALLRSPSDEVLTSLPQLNENANDLKSFLPNREK
jgi:hypothetical protein